ncbi:MAG: hypothetical protein U0694_02300 [Anaerolineae bacterium]
MTLGIILPAVLAFMLLVVDFFFLWMIYRQLKQVWFMNFPWGKTESVAVSEQNIPLPDDAQPFVQLLEQFGFTLLKQALLRFDYSGTEIIPYMNGFLSTATKQSISNWST